MMDRVRTDILNGDELTRRMKTERMGRVLHYFDETDSTNADAKRLADAGAPDGTLVVADAQTKGRGRRGRAWESPAGSSIYFSLLLRPEIPSDRASMLTLVMAVSVAEAIEKVCGGQNVPGYLDDPAALIKWPNDIVMNGRKVCGILTELLLEAEDMKGVIIGVGINVNQGSRLDFPEAVREYAGSVRMACGQELSRWELLADVMQAFEANYDCFLKTCDMNGLKNAYESRLVNIGKQIKVLDPKGGYTGIARGINPFGELQVEADDGAMVSVYAGEVSVRGLYGYT